MCSTDDGKQAQRSHPQLNEISLFFEEELQMFNENKP